jgi:pimeloyl-ACP methyl ester carboxylesterase
MENIIWDLSPLHWQRVGTGKDVLLVHGWASSSRMWNTLVNALEHKYRFWMLDLPGFGNSPLLDMPLTVEHYTALVAAFCEYHQFRPEIVIGHSMGGMLTLKLALMRPDLMDKLVLVCPVVTGRVGWFFDLKTLIHSRLGHLTIQYSKGVWEFAQYVSPFLWSFPPYNTDEYHRRKLEEFRAAKWQAAAECLKSLAAEDLTPALRQIQKPTLVMIGCQDFTVPPDEGRIAAKMIADARLVEFMRSHHHPLDEETPLFLEALDQFLHQNV